MCFMTITKYTDFFLLKKMREAFALQKPFIFFNKKIYWRISDTNIQNFNETLTNDVVSFEQLGPDFFPVKKGSW